MIKNKYKKILIKKQTIVFDEWNRIDYILDYIYCIKYNII